MSNEPSPQVTEAIENAEGFRSHAYYDPIGHVFTVGYGQTGPQVTADTVVTRQQAVEWLQSVESTLISELNNALPWASSLSEPRFGALIDAAYNLGLSGLLQFNEALSAMHRQDWVGAARGFQQSLWFEQVPNRVNTINYMIVFDEWIETYLSPEQTEQLQKALA